MAWAAAGGVGLIVLLLGSIRTFGGYERSNLRVDRMGPDPGSRAIGAAARRPGVRLEILPDEQTSAATSAASNTCAGRRGNKAGVHLTDFRSDLTSASGPRCVSLSGLTIAPMLAIWPPAISSAHT